MDIQIPPEQIAIIESLVATGRFSSNDEAVAEGIRLLASSEKLRQQVQFGVKQADSGQLFDHDSVFSQLRAMADAHTDAKE